MTRPFLLLFVLALSAGVQAQDIPSISLKDLDDQTIDTRAFVEEAEGPVLFCFWATWCSPCKRELNNYADLYPDWQEETGVELVAVSIDDPRSMMRVKPTSTASAGTTPSCSIPTRRLPGPCRSTMCPTPSS